MLPKENESTLSSSMLTAVKHTPLPTMWSMKDKCGMLELNSVGLRVSYKGSGKTDNDAATVRANHSITPSCGIFYFELTIVSKGRDGYIGIGVCTASFPLTRLPGWERNSYGYHGDDGHIFRGSGQGKPYGPTFTTGDVVGCCINFTSNTLFYTKNGVQLGEAATDTVFGKGGNLSIFPCLGLRTPGEIVETNFGQQPFRFDLEQYIKDERLRVFRQLRTTVDIPEGEASSCSSLILSYLIHHGYSETVRVFTRDCGGGPRDIESQLQDMQNRQRICGMVLAGKLETAITELNSVYPGFVEQRRDILFKLLCQKFIEMIKSSPVEETMLFGQTELYQFEKEGSSFRQQLEEVFSLLAYIDPQSSPMAYLLDGRRREPISLELNRALLVFMNKPATPLLENVVRQTQVVVDEVVAQSAGPAAIFMNVPQFLKSENGL